MCGYDAVHAGLLKWYSEAYLYLVLGQIGNIGSTRTLINRDIIFLEKIMTTKLLHDTWKYKHSITEFFNMFVEAIVAFANEFVKSEIFIFLLLIILLS
jgi:hypothetical protein